MKPKAQRAPSSAETPDHVDFHGGTARPRLRLVPQVAESWIPRYRRAAAALDLTVAALAVALTATAARWFDLQPFSPTAAGLLVVLGALGWLGALAQSGAYERRMLGVGTEEFAAMPRAAIRLLAVGALCGAIAYDLLPSGSRLLVLIALPLALVGSLLSRYVLRKRLHRSRILHGTAMQRAVIMGAHEAVAGLVDDMRRDPSHGLLPVAACTSSPREHIPGLEWETPLDQALSTIDAAAADLVVVAHPSELTPEALRRLSWDLEERGVELMVSPGIMEVAGPRLSIRPAASLSLVHVESPTADTSTLVGKALSDRFFATLLSVLLLPVFLVVALAIKIGDRGPVMFRQTRVGAGGETFRIFKFRTMGIDAEDRLDDVRDTHDDGNGTLFKSHADPRVTRVGRILRRYSLDELPQLWNVVLGDMSLVGPRPPLQSEVATYEADAIRRLRVRPGMTGLWQVSGRSDLSWEESLRLDLRYVDNWSMMLDLQILWRTVRAVIRGDGAY